MKQHITCEQWDEFIKDNNIKTIGEACKIFRIDLCEVHNTIHRKTINEHVTIGKMIEILAKPGYDVQLITGYLGINYNRVATRGKSFKEDTLCDALWEAIKEVLNIEDGEQ